MTSDEQLRQRIGKHTMVRFEDEYQGTCFAWKDQGLWRVSSHGEGYTDVARLIQSGMNRRTLRPLAEATQ